MNGHLEVAAGKSGHDAGHSGNGVDDPAAKSPQRDGYQKEDQRGSEPDCYFGGPGDSLKGCINAPGFDVALGGNFADQGGEPS